MKRSSVARDMAGSIIGYVMDRVDPAEVRDDQKRHVVCIGEKTTCRFCWSKLLPFFLKLYVVFIGEDCRRFC